MKFAIIESPFAGDVEQNVQYAKECMIDSINRGEAPFASHLMYTQFLDDDNERQRTIGINAGLEIAKRADLTAVYVDMGISRGMRLGIEAARIANREVVYRSLFNDREGTQR